FYGKIWSLQKEIRDQLSLPPNPKVGPPLMALPRFLDLVAREGPPALARLAASSLDFKELFRRYGDGETPDDPLVEFFPRVLMQLADMTSIPGGARTDDAGEQQRHCPACGDLPQVSVLREDKNADTVRRSLVCARCSHEWPYARVLCPGCKEEKPEKLP